MPHREDISAVCPIGSRGQHRVPYGSAGHSRAQHSAPQPLHGDGAVAEIRAADEGVDEDGAALAALILRRAE